MHARNMGIKDYSGEVSEMRNMLLETEARAILIMKWQRTWLDCDIVFCRRKNCEQCN